MWRSAIWLAPLALISVGVLALCSTGAAAVDAKPSPPQSPAAPALYSIRLAGGRTPNQGRVEIFDGQDWGTVCDNVFEDVDAIVVCRQLGYATGTPIYGWGGGTGPILMGGAECTFEAMPRSLNLCPDSGRDGSVSCRHDQDVGVQCYGVRGAPPRPANASLPPPPPPGPPPFPPPRPPPVPPGTAPPAKYNVRLVNGNYPGEGRLEVYDGQQWGTVCNDGFTNAEAGVVCRQLGYDSGVVVPGDWVWRVWGNGPGRVLMDRVNCSRIPRPDRLQNCSFQGWDNPKLSLDCYQMVGLTCYGKGAPPSPSPPSPPRPPIPALWINLAAGRPAFASSFLTTSADDRSPCHNGECRPAWVTDGVTSDPLRTFRTDSYDLNPWLSIDLGSPVVVQRVRIFYRIDCCALDMGGGIELRVGNVSVAQPADVGRIRANPVVWWRRQPGAASGVLDATLPGAVMGRWLTLQNLRVTSYYVPRVLELLEVQVFGNGTGRPRPPSPQPPLPLPPPPAAFIPDAIAAGRQHTCVLSNPPRAIKCFGRNNDGRLGLGDTLSRGGQPGEMGASLATVSLGPGARPVAVTAGCFHTCALLQGGSVKCWGLNDRGQLGLGDRRDRGGLPGDMGANLPTVNLGPGLTATAVAAGCNHTCALLQPGSLVKCWGNNAAGQLGLGDSQSRGDQPGEMGAALPPVDLGDGRGAAANMMVTGLALGESHSCALLEVDGVAAIKCWGGNTDGQLGREDANGRGAQPNQMGSALRPVDLGRGSIITGLVSGTNHVCALLAGAGGSGGGVKCWGSNSQGQLGLGDTANRGDDADEMGAALPRVALGRSLSVTALAAGEFHTCALLQPNGVVKCWGGNKVGQLGLGDKRARGDQPEEMATSLPTLDLGPGLTVTALASGDRHTCVLLQPGSLVKCWGLNDFGALGLGDRNARGGQLGDMGINLLPVQL